MAFTEKIEIRSAIIIDTEGLTGDQVEQLREYVAADLHRVRHPEDEEVILGWTKSTFAQALKQMESEGSSVQAKTIREALRNSGYVTRDRVYKIGRYSKDRTLRGFTRPSNRVVKEMKAAGVIPSNAASILEPSYQDGVVADGFQVPAALAALLD